MKNAISKYETREEYLLAAVGALKPLFARAGVDIPEVHVSTGWPSSRAVSQKRKTLGECWDRSASADKVPQIFISPWMSDCLNACPPSDDASGVLPTLVHELVHAVLGYEAGHGPKFRKLALAVGLEGKMTSTHAGTALVAELKAIMPTLGEYPHAKLDPAGRPTKKQGTRMIKCECASCGYTIRISKKWLEIGIPECPCGAGELVADEQQ